MVEPSAHIDGFIADNLPARALWPEMDYSVLPELAAYPSRFNAAVELLDRQAEAGYADKPMFRFGESVWSWADMLARANRIANLLVDEFGLVPGNRGDAALGATTRCWPPPGTRCSRRAGWR